MDRKWNVVVLVIRNQLDDLLKWIVWIEPILGSMTGMLLIRMTFVGISPSHQQIAIAAILYPILTLIACLLGCKAIANPTR